MPIPDQQTENMQFLQAMPKMHFAYCAEGEVIPVECGWNEGAKVTKKWQERCELAHAERVRLLAPGQKEIPPPPKLLIEPPKKRGRKGKEEDKPENYEC